MLRRTRCLNSGLAHACVYRKLGLGSAICLGWPFCCLSCSLAARLLSVSRTLEVAHLFIKPTFHTVELVVVLVVVAATQSAIPLLLLVPCALAFSGEDDFMGVASSAAKTATTLMAGVVGAMAVQGWW
jgi:hypothetical protein